MFLQLSLRHNMAGVVQGGWFGKARSAHHVLGAARCVALVAQKLVQVASALEPKALAGLQVAHSVCHHSPFPLPAEVVGGRGAQNLGVMWTNGQIHAPFPA